MRVVRVLAMLGLLFGLAACVSGGTGGKSASAQPLKLAAQYDVAEVKIVVPQTLRVSEANSYRPNADIVWRGDPPGDR